jgi:hypothetical protein
MHSESAAGGRVVHGNRTHDSLRSLCVPPPPANGTRAWHRSQTHQGLPAFSSMSTSLR